jgi:O6-methylguanine-DNA--protein-cysteine methyltransferase
MSTSAGIGVGGSRASQEQNRDRAEQVNNTKEACGRNPTSIAASCHCVLLSRAGSIGVKGRGEWQAGILPDV